MGKKFPLPPWLEHSAMVKKKMKDRGFKMADRVQLCEKCDEFAEQPGVVRQVFLPEKLARRRVERLRILDGVELLALLVALGDGRVRLLAQVLGQRRAAPGEEPVEVRLVLGVPGGILEALALAA